MTSLAHQRLPEAPLLDVGDGPPVLLLHGTAPGTTAQANFSQLIPALQDYRVLAPDLLGFGNSPLSPTLEYGPGLWARQAWQLLDERDISQVVLVGNSMGARIALTMAVSRSERIRGLVLFSTRMTQTTTPAQALLRNYTPSLAGMEHLLRECFVTDQALVTPEVVRERFLASARPGAHEAMQRVFKGLAGAPGPATHDIARLRIPSLLMHGREDRIVPFTDGAKLADLMPHADLHILAGTGHWFQLERAATVNPLITGFLGRLP